MSKNYPLKSISEKKMHITWNTGGAAVVFFLVFQLGAHIPKRGGLGPPLTNPLDYIRVFTAFTEWIL